MQGTTKNSPAHHALKQHPSWTWSRLAHAWLLRSSRHRPPKPHVIAEIERILAGLDYTVEREIHDTTPSVEQQETDLAERLESRQSRLPERADSMAARAETTHASAARCFPDNGQPLLTDHPSYPADKRRRDRGHQLMGCAIEQRAHADDLAQRAESSAQHQARRTSSVTIGNRITTMEAEQRRLRRELEGTRELRPAPENGRARLVLRPPSEERAEFLRRELASVADKIGYWKGVYAGLQTEGAAPVLGPDTVATGDWVLTGHGWARVCRVNGKSLTVPNPVFPAPGRGEAEETWTVPWHKLRDHRTTEDMDPAFADIYETPGTDRIGLWNQFHSTERRCDRNGEP